MEKNAFNKISKAVFLSYGFIKEKNRFVLQLQDVTIVVKFCSWRGVKSFNYYFFINALYDDSIPFEKRFDSLIEIKMEHTPSLQGYDAHEIIYEKYDEAEYRRMLDEMLHRYFDPYKSNAIQYLRENDSCMVLSKKARQFLGLV